MTTPNQPMSQLWPLTVTTPAGTLSSSPLITPWPLADANLEWIEIVVPDGPSGQVGVAVYWSGTQIVPWGTDSWIITNNEKLHIPVDSYITISGLSVYTYNEGIFDHTVYLRALVKYTTTPVVTEQSAIGTTSLQNEETSSYDESLTPGQLTSTLSLQGPQETEQFSEPVQGSLTALPESVT